MKNKAIWFIVFISVILYMVVNESERIETRRELGRFTQFQSDLVNNLIKKHDNHEHYYNGKPKPSDLIIRVGILESQK